MLHAAADYRRFRFAEDVADCDNTGRFGCFGYCPLIAFFMYYYA